MLTNVVFFKCYIKLCEINSPWKIEKAAALAYSGKFKLKGKKNRPIFYFYFSVIQKVSSAEIL